MPEDKHTDDVSTTHKGSMSVVEYLTKMRNFAYELATARKSFEELAPYINSCVIGHRF
jgi:hypothetical protein